MTQSVELLLDAATDAEIRAQWDQLGDAGLPTSRRVQPSPSHAPHITLWAGNAIDPADDAALPGLFADLDLELVVGNVLLFGPRRGGYVLVRQVLASAALLDLQQQVVRTCRTRAYPGFEAGRWSPHVTPGPPGRDRPGGAVPRGPGRARAGAPRRGPLRSALGQRRQGRLGPPRRLTPSPPPSRPHEWSRERPLVRT